MAETTLKEVFLLTAKEIGHTLTCLLGFKETNMCTGVKDQVKIEDRIPIGEKPIQTNFCLLNLQMVQLPVAIIVFHLVSCYLKVSQEVTLIHQLVLLDIHFKPI